MDSLKTQIKPDALAIDVKFSRDTFTVVLADGREITVPLEWSPRLRSATVEQRKNWQLIGKGIGIHWRDIDEDLSVESLLAVS